MLDLIIPTPPDGARLALDLVGLRQEIDKLELRFSQTAATFAKTNFWDDEGSNSALDWIRFNCRMTSNAAADRLTVGDRLANLGRSAAAMDGGEIGFAHLAVMARTAEAVGEAFDEGKLLQLAKLNSPGKFHYKCLHYRHSVDAKAYADDQERLAEERSLRLSTAEDGCLLISGLLDLLAGPPCARHWSRWPSFRVPTTTAIGSSATPTRSSTWRPVASRPTSRSPRPSRP